MAVDVELFDDWDALAADAGGALDRASQPRLFDRIDWYRLIAAHSPPGGKVLAARARDGGDAAWLVLATQDGKAEPWANWYSLSFDAVYAGAEDARDKLLTAIAKALRRHLSSIALSPLPADSRLLAAFRAGGWLAFETTATMRWDIETAGMDFDAYWAARPGQLRSTFKRKAKAAALDVAIHRNFDAGAWADYEAVYRASWKPGEGAPAMLRALAEQEGAAGNLRLGIARADGRPIAAQLWLVEHGEATIHKLAYAEEAKALSPGTILSHAMFRAAIDIDTVRRIDFGTGDDSYKRDWMARRTPLIRLDAFNPRSATGLAGAARASASALVRRVRTR